MVDADPERVAASLVTIGVGIGLAIAGVQAVAHLTNVFALDADVDSLSADIDGANAFAWASSMATLAAGLAALTLAIFEPARARRHLLLAGILIFFSLDDVAAIHEKLGTAVRGDVLGLPTGWGRLVWPALFFPLLAAALLLLWELRRRAPRAAATGLGLGLACLVAAVVAEVASTPWYTTGGTGESWFGALEVVVEEGLEIVGWAAIATAMAGAAYATLVRGRLGQAEHA
ncbi:MAG TPA: hypothetical protein VF236_01690 [Gaiellaceae bacterium]